MPAPQPYLPSLRKYPLATALCAALLGPLTQADEIIVVTDSQHPVHATSDVRLIELDQPTRIKAELGAHLPADPARGAALVQRRLKDGGSTLQARLGTAYQGVVDAWSFGVTTIPAVIVDRHYVVYGEPDVAKAVALIEAHRRTQP
ncbi:TIGR03757 family integrating conjugative element protein [Pseudomonas chengduensis]|uniref:TIGR03757 family integrating conjugative element protein n=1 Tax=Pseudomonas sediminis TaxID=1691904 RepID=UPI00244737C0|nr:MULTISPECIES: TIGR03757 family integrating conjugative element protein [Pseudomonas]MDG9757832.1 TIGR03757 family integrating conjugative element protein [Pseudomonas sediminis]MDH0622962.1 TIGR03757 family integrating conjugative element protein [Pseudomonas chengduensis]MDH1664543.1 TIGR03757 family integrating conjugative element protein [Pseudomonas chengduensis]